ncbi:MAG: FecR/PupR family sigma factor regulator, partial [Gammaproteobacteria bacterium]|nr:FecR/PupR family sigma factor regulator [Gammaproteobacteria bacterium]
MKDSAKIIRFPQKEKVREVAAHWIVQLDDGQLSKEKEQQFIKWLNASQLHKQEFFNLCYVWGKYDFFADLANVIPMDKSDNSNTNVCWNIHFRNVFVAGIIIGLAGLLVMMYSSTLEQG